MSKAAQAALELEEAFFRAVPPDKKKTLNAEWASSLERFHRDAREIRTRHALGVLARARAAYLLQRRLMAAGLPADVVRKVVFALVTSSFVG